MQKQELQKLYEEFKDEVDAYGSVSSRMNDMNSKHNLLKHQEESGDISTKDKEELEMLEDEMACASSFADGEMLRIKSIEAKLYDALPILKSLSNLKNQYAIKTMIFDISINVGISENIKGIDFSNKLMNETTVTLLSAKVKTASEQYDINDIVYSSNIVIFELFEWEIIIKYLNYSFGYNIIHNIILA